MVRPALALTTMGAVAENPIEFHDLRGKLPERAGVKYEQRDEASVEGVILHHSFTHGATIRSIAEFHTQQKQWPAIAYHAAIGYDGQVYLLHDFSTLSFHASGWNKRTIGVVLIGDYHRRGMTPAMKDAVLKTMDWVDGKMDLKFIKLHRDTKSTACPGDSAVKVLRPLCFDNR